MATLLQQLLSWVDEHPRSYAEAMEAWRSSCPRFPVWEDALAGNLIQVARNDGGRLSDCRVTLTAQGRRALGGRNGA